MTVSRHGRLPARRRAMTATAVLVLVVTTLGGLLSSLQQAGADRATESARAGAGDVAGELLVRFEPAGTAAERSQVLARHQLTVVRSLPLPGLELVRYDGPARPADKALEVTRERAVRYAEPNFVHQPDAVIPNDPSFSTLWGLHNTGQSSGTVDADIDAPEAWEVTSGSGAVVVGVIDTGVDISHPDLAANIWVNPGELAANGVDDDGNGFVDDVNGWDFLNGDNSVFDAVDGDEHGTHVAGTIAAVMDNTSLVVGVSQARILPLKFLGPDGGSTSNAILAIDYALNLGVRITNNSWGGGGMSQALADKIAAANTAGMLFVAAAGNGGADGVGDNNDTTPHYPSSYSSANVISVAATDRNDQLGSFSNFGASSVDLGAPGVAIVSTVPPSTDAKAVLTGPDTSPGTAYHAALHTFGLEGVPALSDRTALLGAALAWSGASTAAPILLVDDDTGLGHQSAYTAALGSLGYSVTTHTVPTGGCVNGPNAVQMSSYQAVVWFTGPDYDCTLTSGDQSSLSTYLNGGGDVALFGVDIGYDLTDNDAVTNVFLRDKLRARFVADFDDRYEVLGVAATPYAGVGQVELDANPSSPTWQRYSSAVAARQGAVAALKPTPPPGPLSTYNGTSMATPHVAGALAQVLASYPTITAAAAKARVLNQGDARPALSATTLSGRRLNLAGALDTAGAPAISAVSASPATFAAGSGATTLGWTLNEPSRITIAVSPTLVPGAPVRTVALGARSAASHTWVWDGRDDAGNAVPAGSYQLQVTATDVTGATSAAAATATATGPGPPQNVVGTARNAGATVTWSPPASNGGNTITSYTVTANPPAGGASAPPQTVNCPGGTCPALTATFSGLTNSLTLPDRGGYTFSVAAVTSAGTGPAATTATVFPQVTAGTFTPVTPARILNTRTTNKAGLCPDTLAACVAIGPAGTLTLQVSGQGLVPSAGVSAVVMNVTAINPTAASFLTVWPSDAARPTASNLNVSANQAPVPNLVTVKLGEDGLGRVNIFNNAGTVDVTADVVGWYSNGTTDAGARFSPLTPARILNTRTVNKTGLCPTTTAACVAIGPAATRTVQVSGQGLVPSAGVSAVVMNVTAINPTAASFLTVWPSDAARPTASNLNVSANQAPVPNLVVVKLGSDGLGRVNIYNNAGTVDVTADVVGWYGTAGAITGSRLTPLTPARILNTRTTNKTGLCPTTLAACVAIGPAGTLTLQVSGQGGVPSGGATGILMSVTALNCTAASFLTVYPSDAARPTASNLNCVASQPPVPNLMVVKLGTDGLGRVKIYNNAGTVDVTADVVGWFNDGSS